jgi:putative (di)nucleoside polyphosphate hydrolase
MTRAKPKDLPYRRGVGIVLLNPRGLVFVARRIDTPADAWQLPQGGIDKGEKPPAAAFRELEEETGTARAEILAKTRGWISYDLPADLVPRVWNGRFRGQKQKWFAMRFLGRDSDIDIATKNPEFDAWKWAPIDSLPEVIVAFKRALYVELVRQFKPLAEKVAAGGGGGET